MLSNYYYLCLICQSYYFRLDFNQVSHQSLFLPTIEVLSCYFLTILMTIEWKELLFARRQLVLLLGLRSSYYYFSANIMPSLILTNLDFGLTTDLWINNKVTMNFTKNLFHVLVINQVMISSSEACHRP